MDVGIELEYSDILGRIAQNELEKIFGYKFTEWQNSFSIENKLKLDYSKWNSIVDNTIKNTDGSKCSLDYMVGNDKYPISSKEQRIEHSRGIEVVSPKTNNYKELMSDIEKINKAMISSGATISRYLDDALHIHVDATELSTDQIKKIPLKCLPIQKSLTKLLTYDGIPVPLYSEQDAKLFIKCNSIYEIKQVYIAKEGHGSYSIDHFLNRKIIDIGPWLKKPHPLKTIEFRAYSMSRNIEYIEECLKLSLDIYDYLVNDTILVNFENRVEWIDSLN
jgi:hypothetical protein